MKSLDSHELKSYQLFLNNNFQYYLINLQNKKKPIYYRFIHLNDPISIEIKSKNHK